MIKHRFASLSTTTKLILIFSAAVLPLVIVLIIGADDALEAAHQAQIARADEEAVAAARAIDNLVDNAISFSPAGGLVEVVVAWVGDKVRIRIDDEGPGVPPDVREAIFNRFVSVRPESDEFGRHSGLGLAIARAIVKGHDGEIDVADRDDAPSGARFTICMPAAPAAGDVA